MHSVIQDLRWGVRTLRSTPGLTLTAIFTLALGIAASSTVFGWIDAVLLDPIPGAARGGDLVEIETLAPNGAPQNTSYRDYRDYRDSLKQISGLAASLANVFTLGDERNPQLQWGEFVSSNYFDVMGVKALRGRTFRPEDGGDEPGGAPVVEIGERLWTSLYQRDPGSIGRKLRINGRDLTIVGVIPEAFHGAVPGLVFQVWLPAALAPAMNGQGPWLLDQRNVRQMWLTGRLAPGVTVERAGAEAVALARSIAAANPDTNRGCGAAVVPVWQGHAGGQALLREPLKMLLAVSLVLFLIVAANVANLQIARGAARVKEFAIRLALGAGALRLTQQLLTESLLLSAAGAAAGALLAGWAGKALVWLLPPTGLPVEFQMPMNWHVLVFTMALCLAAALLTGLAPVLHALDARVNTRLKESARGTTSGAARRTRAALVVSEVALALVALAGTGLCLFSFCNARSMGSGMDVRNVASVKYYVETFCHTSSDRTRFCTRLGERLRAMPGVTAVSYSNSIPLEFGDHDAGPVEVEGYVPAAGEAMQTPNCNVSPGYFETLGIPIVEGRDFTERDDTDTAPVTIVNQSFARRYFGGGPAVGRRLRTGGPWFTVVGVAADAKYGHLTEAPAPYYYTAFRQTQGGEFWMAFFVRTAGPVRGELSPLDREAATVDPAARASNFVACAEWMEASLYGQRVAAILVGVVGAISLILSAVGLYSVLAFTVSQRTNEFGIRMALGAGPWQLLATVLRQGLALTAAGLGAGVLAALAAMRFASGYLPQIGTAKPEVFAAATLVLGLVTLLASYLPARRATRIDPVDALRQE